MLNSNNSLTASVVAFSSDLPPPLGQFLVRDHQHSSYSANGVQDLLPVQFKDPLEEKEYNNVFFVSGRGARKRKPRGGVDTPDVDTPKSKIKEGPTLTGDAYFLLAKNLAQISNDVSAIHGALRSIFIGCTEIDSYPDNVASILAANRSSTSVDELAIYTKTYVEALRNNNMHIIRPSTKFKGGYDIIFCGVPTGSGMGALAGPILFRKFRQGRDWPRKSSYSSSESIEERAAKSAVGKAATAATAEFYKALFGGDGVSVGSSTKRVVQILPLDFDFQAQMSKVLSKLTTVSPKLASTLKAVSEISSIPLPLVKGLSKFVSLVVMREPNKEAVNRKIVSPGIDDAALGISAEQVQLDSDISFSFCLHLPEHICEYITQTSGKHIPMVPINTWASIWVKAMVRVPGSKSGGERITPRRAPRYVLPASQIDAVNGRRKSLGFWQEPGRTNPDGICVSNTGRLNWHPKASELTTENAKAYEQLLEEALQLSYDAGTPLNSNQQGVTNKAFALANKEYAEKIEQIKKRLTSYIGSVQAVSWDYNCVLSVGSNPERLTSTTLAGATVAGNIGINQVLETPMFQAMVVQFPEMTDSSGERIKDPRYLSSSPGELLQINIFKRLFETYTYLLWNGLVPTFAKLVESAAKALELVTLELGASADQDSPQQYERGLYQNYIKDTLVIESQYNLDVKVRGTSGLLGAESQTRAIEHIVKNVLRDAAARPGSNLARICVSTGLDVQMHERYLNLEFMPLSDFNRIYKYLGGQIFLQMLRAIHKVPPKELMIINSENPFRLPPYSVIASQVMPLCILFGKYVPDHEKIKEEAEKETEALKPDTSIGASDIHLPGSGPNFRLFPHQLECQQTLRKKPKFAVLDVAPGGGKTVSLLLDIAQLIGESEIKRACVICPDNLMKNWIEDMHKVSQGKWNIIPINRISFDGWGPEAIEDLMDRAPRNTIYVIGMNFFRKDNYAVVLGNHAEIVSAALEFIKKFSFDYIAIDESHRAKNTGTVVHRAIRQLTTASCVKFVRLATGSLISNKLTDIVGQSAVMTAQMFRTAAEYEKDNMVAAADGSRAMVWREDTPARARKQMAKFAAVMTFKKKHWAFLLPNPIQHFFSVALHKNQEIDGDGNPRNPMFVDAEIGNAHQALYEAVLKETLKEMTEDEEIMKILKKKKTGASDALAGKDDAADDDAADDGDEDDGDDGADIDGDISEDAQSKLETLLEPYLQRLEMLLSNPMNDPLGKEAFAGLDEGRIVSNKVLMAISRIRLNFDLSPWVKGQVYHFGGDFVDYEGKRYALYDNGTIPEDQFDLGYKSVLPPDKDGDHWKEESYGKVIVFCRYTSTVEAVYNALPPDLKKLAFMFHGGCADRYENLDRLKKEPFSFTKGMQIVIANEQAITEGHNLQMCSRQIRMESPWAPGDLDQATSRIFRPDVERKFKRENVYIDWVMANGTLEVAKFARLISKIIVKAKFDEADNPNYTAIQSYQLPTIRMGLDVFKAQPSLSDVKEYTDAYNHFDSIQRTEFAEMRAKKDVNMIDIPQFEMFKEAKILEQVPYLPNLNVPDRHDMGLIPMKDYLESEDPKVKVFLKEKGVIGLPVHTERGNGIIVKVVHGKKSRANLMVRVEVRLVNGDSYSTSPSMLFIATKVDEKSIKNFSPVRSTVTRGDASRAAKRNAAVEKVSAREQRRRDRQALRESAELAALQGKTKPVRGTRTPKADATPPAAPNYVDLYPTIYNGFWALEGVLHEDAVGDLSKHGYRTFDDYAWIVIRDHPTLSAVQAFLAKKFVIAADSLKRLNDLQSSFSGRGKKFMAELFPTAQLKTFLKINHTLAGVDKTTGRPIVKVYPTLLNGGLMLNIDLKTNPAVKRLLNKAIPGCTAKFQEAEGLHIKFFTSKAEVEAEMQNLAANGFTVTNEAEVIQQLEKLVVKKPSK